MAVDRAAFVADAPLDAARERTTSAPLHVWEHERPLPGGDWVIWRPTVLRGTGFPVSTMAGLAGMQAPSAADEYSDTRADVIRLRRLALAQIGQDLRACPPSARAALRARRRRIRQGRIARDATTHIERALASATEARAAAHARLIEVYRAETQLIDARLAGILADPRFREAVRWQNPRALSLIDRRFQAPAGARADRRAAGDLVAMLIQRYALKNDSIGFFGPVGWGSLSEQEMTVDISPGAGLLARRAVYFEGWCIDALADALDAHPSVRCWTAPRLAGGVWQGENGVVHVPLVGQVAVSEGERRVLALCDGERSAREIADVVLRHPESDLRSEDDVFAALRALVDRRVLVWRLDVAPQLHPDHELRRRLHRIGDPRLRQECFAALDALVEARDAVARASGDPDALDERLTALNTTFTGLTGRAPTRRVGQMYAGRTLVYEDCRRAGRVTLGAAFLARLGPPLTLVLESARWVAAELARGFRVQMRQCYAALARERRDAVDAHEFYTRVTQIPLDERMARIRDVERRFRERWQFALGVDGEPRRVSRSVDQIALRAREAFLSRSPLWSRVRFLSPDVLVAADGPEAFRRGDFHCVLGEIHSGNGLLWSALASQHPDPQELADAVERDAREVTPIVTQVLKSDWSARLNVAARPPCGWRYEFHDDRPSQPGCRPMPAAMLVPSDDGLTVTMRTRDGNHEFDAIELFGLPLCWEVDSVLKQYLPDAPHVPRVTIGALTIARERWCATRDELPFVTEPDRAARFAALRAWARGLGLPRRVFYKFPRERKPCYLDFDSPLYSDLFLKGVRSLEEGIAVRLDEMFPGIAETWLADGTGDRYTSEFRFATRLASPGCLA